VHREPREWQPPAAAPAPQPSCRAASGLCPRWGHNPRFPLCNKAEHITQRSAEPLGVLGQITLLEETFLCSQMALLMSGSDQDWFPSLTH